MTEVFIGLGANLAQPQQQLLLALSALQTLPETRLVNCSSLYSSKPLGPQEQPDYVNAVALLHTELTPLALLDELQAIEQQQGRQRKAERWGARTLDLDIILFGDQQIDCPRLTIPHYHFTQREFVLYPLAELAPELVLPDGRCLNTLLEQVPRNGLTVILPAAKIELA